MPKSRSPNGIHTPSPLQRTWMAWLSNGMALRNAAQVFGASFSSKRALKLNSPTWTTSWLIDHPVLPRKVRQTAWKARNIPQNSAIRYRSGGLPRLWCLSVRKAQQTTNCSCDGESPRATEQLVFCVKHFVFVQQPVSVIDELLGRSAQRWRHYPTIQVILM